MNPKAARTWKSAEILPLVGMLLFLGATRLSAEPPDLVSAATGTAEKLAEIQQPFVGDLPDLRKRRLIRVLVSYSRTNFFFEGGRPRGFEYELLTRYEQFLNKKARPNQRVRLTFIPVPFDRLLTALHAGHGDIAAAGLTITPAREKLVAFSRPYLPDVREVVVHHRDVDDIQRIEDLSSRLIYVPAGTSYARHLRALNRELATSATEPLTTVEAASHLVTEDILELVNAGVVPITVADEHIAQAWAKVLPNIVVRDDLVVHTGGEIAWAVRKDNPKLRASLDAFINKHKKGSLLGNVLFERYYEDSEWVKNPTEEQEREKLEKTASLFKKYAERYDLDWLALAAQAYQESGLNNEKVSKRGAVGVMQILPSTAADKSVNIQNIRELENNIHAGAKYLAYLRDRYYGGAEIDPDAKMDFVWAAYNAGPSKINQLRRKAERSGINPNIWFSNVEQLAARHIGRETVSYVANINKYYVAYKLHYEAQRYRRTQLQMLKAAPHPSPD